MRAVVNLLFKKTQCGVGITWPLNTLHTKTFDGEQSVELDQIVDTVYPTKLLCGASSSDMHEDTISGRYSPMERAHAHNPYSILGVLLDYLSQ